MTRKRWMWPAYGLSLILVLVAASEASAHALGAEARLRGGRVEVEAYYDDDTPARDARVTILDEEKNAVAQGRTDAQGRCSFPAPKPGVYHVVVDAGAGHRTSIKITLPPGAGQAASPSEQRSGPVADESSPGSPEAGVSLGGPRREEFTRFPLLKLTIGLGIIAVVGMAVWLVLRGQRPGQPHAPPSEAQPHLAAKINLATKQGERP